ncbi:LysR family transcriptional regulator [Asaia sp. W19]|uniref:LysR family transcriptional regulator n=1 Tax=Asaia krungthepensis NRIC 0535 TaxID=1307925 RepID=A0ABQ0Q0R8_9PROT|nr:MULTISPECIES: LysR family transcriptional regulator [Asaia]RUT24751.1 LysR family transcriptional regulator [Asaia sp. W19]GBQ86300.1 LysR family transcriptional regulator [Asaia krungthepensis NRIC 0535]
MRRDELVDLNAFLAVAEEQSFTRAAARLGTSQSALSHTVRRLETRLGVRLLTRTTRRVSATEAGERLLQTLVPALDSIAGEIASLSELSERPSGTIRLTASEHAAQTLIWPALKRLLPDYPDIEVELAIDSGLTDIVAERFDAGVRLEETIARDMIAVPIGPPLRMAVVGAPDYFARYPCPRSPQDLSAHQCLKLRMSSSGAIYAWELEKGRRSLRVRPEGPLTINNAAMLRQAALDGFGLACVMEDQIMDHVAAGRLVRVLEDWCPPFPGYHLYYPSRRNASAAFRILVEALRYRG